MVRSRATLENEGLRWFRQALATEKLIDELRSHSTDNVSEFQPRPRQTRVRSAEPAIVRVRGTA